MFSLISLPVLVGALGGSRTLAVLSFRKGRSFYLPQKRPERPVFRRVPLFFFLILLFFVLEKGFGIPKDQVALAAQKNGRLSRGVRTTEWARGLEGTECGERLFQKELDICNRKDFHRWTPLRVKHRFGTGEELSQELFALCARERFVVAIS